MKILIHATAFYPMIGGYEAMAEAVAKGLAQLGHEVMIVTQARPPENSEDSDLKRYPFEVLRRPSFFRWAAALRQADACLSFNLSIKGMLPWLIQRKPLVISHQGWYSDFNTRPKPVASLKLMLCRLATNISCSSSVADYLKVSSIIIPNTYDETVFYERPEIPRQRDIIFVGRLVSDKGPEMVLAAAVTLRQHGLRPTITFAGAGPEAEPLRVQAQRLGLQDQVEFVGAMRGSELGRLMNQHRILAVPSIWAEPFGIVALEGIASGCIVVGSDQGGLREAIGSCGMLFPNRNIDAFAHALRLALCPNTLDSFDKSVRKLHLDAHAPRTIAKAYAGVLSQAIHIG